VLLFLSLPIAVSTLAGSPIPILVALLIVLPVLAIAQRRRPTPTASGRAPRLTTLPQLALAVAVVTVAGSLAAIVLSLLLNGLGIGGSGATLLQVTLAICVLAPCFSLGTLCGRWWAFSGSLPMLGLVAIGQAPLALLMFAATSCALQLGSLHASGRGPGRSGVVARL
jgi:hypothetical protein